MKIAIIGNSPSILNKGYGEEIDSHDVVFRINNYDITDKESDFGKKTTDIMLAIITIKERGDNCYKNIDDFLKLTKEHRFVRNNSRITFDEAFDGKISKNDVILFDDTKTEQRMKEKYKYNKSFSAGLVTMQYAYDTYQDSKIDVYGITFFKDKSLHFYDNQVNTYHDGDIEEEYFNKFLSDRITLHN